MQVTDLNNIDLDNVKLPESLRELIDVVGLDATALLLKKYGGGRIYVPKQPTPENQIIALLGNEIAGRMIARYQLCKLELPKLDALLRPIRDQEIRSRHTKGESITSLAEEYNLTHRHLYRIIG